MVDPVLRCDSCQKLVKHETLQELGCCPKCGNKRVRDVTVMDEDEQKQVSEWGFADFLKEFKEVDDD